MLAQEYKVNAQTGSLAATATYMPGPSGPSCRVDETNQTEGYYPAGITSTAPLGRGVTHWYVYDGLGSVIGELDDNNNLTTSRQYDVYGAPRAGTLQGSAATSPQGYVGSLGHVTDAGTGGLIYMQARYYDPGVGRFVSEDPKGNGNNWYAYAADNPVCYCDNNGCVLVSIGISAQEVVESIVQLLQENPEATMQDVFECFGGDVYVSTAIEGQGGVRDAVGLLRFYISEDMENIPGVSQETEGIASNWIADEIGQSGLAHIAEDPELVDLAVLEGAVIEEDAATISIAEML